MKKNNFLFSFVVFLLFIILFPITAYANSSWHWVSSTRPLDLLPIVVIVTLLIEIFSINNIGKVKDLKRVVPAVSLANLISFLIPYAWIGINPNNVYSLHYNNKGISYAINYTIEHTPVFTVSFMFLMITLLVETPIIYSFFRKRVSSKKTLIIVIIVANILTTAITFAVERIFCYGEW